MRLKRLKHKLMTLLLGFCTLAADARLIASARDHSPWMTSRESPGMLSCRTWDTTNLPVREQLQSHLNIEHRGPNCRLRVGTEPQQEPLSGAAFCISSQPQVPLNPATVLK